MANGWSEAKKGTRSVFVQKFHTGMLLKIRRKTMSWEISNWQNWKHLELAVCLYVQIT